MGKIYAERYHDFSYGHRVHNHESKCANLHGHNGRVHFTIEAEELDSVGRVMDFSVIKTKLCTWLEDNWDHKFLAWEDDPIMKAVYFPLAGSATYEEVKGVEDSIILVPFNPTAENMAKHLVEVIGPQLLDGMGCRLVKVKFEETRKCCAIYEIRNITDFTCNSSTGGTE